MHTRIVALVMALAVISFSGCSPCHDLSVSLNLTTGDPDVESHHLYFATDRTWVHPGTSVGDYGASRGSVTYGTCDVEVPIYAPPDAASMFGADAEFKLFKELDDYVSAGPADRDPVNAFFLDVAGAVAASSPRELLLFVHGYNVTFKDAVQKTGFLAHRLGFPGPAVLFSWPSNGETGEYRDDEISARDALPDFRTFLVDLASRSGAQKIHVIAHSMGARSLTDAVVGAVGGGQLPGASPFGQVVLAAADIDAAEFQQGTGTTLRSVCDGVTLYVSRKDKALVLSEKVHGEHRVGDCRDQITVVAGIETIDASKLPCCLLGHSYYSDSSVVTEDLKKLILEGRSAGARGLERDEGRQCWILPKRLN